MITVEAYLLQGHKPSGNVSRIVDLYLGNCPGVVLQKTWVSSGNGLREVLRKNKLTNLPAVKVPGKMVRGRRPVEIITDHDEIETWCKDTVNKIDSANRRRR